MARPKSIEDEEILEAARQVFLEEGIQATTAAIAEHAGISEGTIYRRWPTKHDLFTAAMDIPYPPGWMETLAAIEDEADLFDALTRLGLEIIEFFEEIIPKINMVMCNLEENQIFNASDEPPPVRGMKPIIQFFHRQRRAARLKQRDPEIVARMFMGSLHHFAFSEVSGLNEFMPMPRETYVRGVVKNLLEGIQQED